MPKLRASKYQGHAIIQAVETCIRSQLNWGVRSEVRSGRFASCISCIVSWADLSQIMFPIQVKLKRFSICKRSASPIVNRCFDAEHRMFRHGNFQVAFVFADNARYNYLSQPDRSAMHASLIPLIKFVFILWAKHSCMKEESHLSRQRPLPAAYSEAMKAVQKMKTACYLPTVFPSFQIKFSFKLFPFLFLYVFRPKSSSMDRQYSTLDLVRQIRWDC